MYTLAFRKLLNNKKMSVGLTATNPFNQYINKTTTIKMSNYISYSQRQLPFRSFGVSFTYKFGKSDVKDIKNADAKDNAMNDGN